MRSVWMLVLTVSLSSSSSCLPAVDPSLFSLRSDEGMLIGDENGGLALTSFQLSVVDGEVGSISDLIWESGRSVAGAVGESVSWTYGYPPERGTKTLTLLRVESARRGVTVELQGENAIDGVIIETGRAVLEVRGIGEKQYYHLARTISGTTGNRVFDGWGAEGGWSGETRGDDLFHIAPPNRPLLTGSYSARFSGPGTIDSETLDESLIVTVEFDAEGQLTGLSDIAGAGSARAELGSTNPEIAYVDYGAEAVTVYVVASRAIPTATYSRGVQFTNHYSGARLRITRAGGNARGVIERQCVGTPQWVSNWDATADFGRDVPPPDLPGHYTGTVSGTRVTEYVAEGSVQSVDLSVPVTFEFDDNGRLLRLTEISDPDRPADVFRSFWTLDYRDGHYTDYVTERYVAWVRYLNGGVQVRVGNRNAVYADLTYEHSQAAVITILRDGAAVSCRVDWTELSAYRNWPSLYGPDPAYSGTWLGEGSLLRSVP